MGALRTHQGLISIKPSISHALSAPPEELPRGGKKAGTGRLDVRLMPSVHRRILPMLAQLFAVFFLIPVCLLASVPARAAPSDGLPPPNLSDLTMLGQNWNQSVAGFVPAAGPSAVPEPSSLALLAVLAGLI